MKGFHCLSGWDGTSASLVEKVKSKLRDPESFEHVETKVTPVEKGEHSIIMRYRARNGFGGLNVDTAMGTLSHSTCDAELITEAVPGYSDSAPLVFPEDEP